MAKFFHIDLTRPGNTSSSLRRRINKFGYYDADLKRHIVPSLLIGQLGKNFAHGYNELITGDELLTIACNVVADIQLLSSGKIVYWECEDNPRLLEFYRRNGFRPFNTRKLDSDEIANDGERYLVQLFRYL